MTTPDRQDDGLRSALQQIKIVCVDNAATTVRHDLALEFVGGIAERALKPVITEDDGSGDPLPQGWTPPPSPEAAEGAGRPDCTLSCQMHQYDGVCCADDDCDIEMGVRAPPKPAPGARHSDSDDFLTQARKTIEHLSHATDVVMGKPTPDATEPWADGRPVFLPEVGPAPDAMRVSRRTEQNTDSKTWTAGIDVLRQYDYQDKQWHLSAIEVHHKDEQEAVRLRDVIFTALSAPVPPADGAISDMTNAQLAMALRNNLSLVGSRNNLRELMAAAAARLVASPEVAS